MRHKYEKVDENFNVKSLPMNDFDGKITGKCVMGLKAYFDENPEEAKRLGWIKHYTLEEGDFEFDEQTQYFTISQEQIDEYTIRDVPHVFQKTEEMMLKEEQDEARTFGSLFHLGIQW